MRPFSIIFFLLALCNVLISQPAGQKPSYVSRYTQAQVLDSTEGMIIYFNMMKMLKMDHELLSKEGNTVQGWNEEYYDDGQLMHISYYKESKLVLFKNFYENGQCQHHITYTDPANCNIDVYFEAGGLKNQLHFVNGQPQKMTEFFANGLPKSQVEFDQAQQCITSRRTWFLNAELQSELVLSDPAKKKYSEKAFYPNGQLKEEGELIYSSESKEYIKTGTWLTFENSGKKKNSEKFRFSLGSN